MDTMAMTEKIQRREEPLLSSSMTMNPSNRRRNRVKTDLRSIKVLLVLLVLLSPFLRPAASSAQSVAADLGLGFAHRWCFGAAGVTSLGLGSGMSFDLSVGLIGRYFWEMADETALRASGVFWLGKEGSFAFGAGYEAIASDGNYYYYTPFPTGNIVLGFAILSKGMREGFFTRCIFALPESDSKRQIYTMGIDIAFVVGI
jgi:hypothetical protein